MNNLWMSEARIANKMGINFLLYSLSSVNELDMSVNEMGMDFVEQ
jgi:hypothetical protein